MKAKFCKDCKWSKLTIADYGRRNWLCTPPGNISFRGINPVTGEALWEKVKWVCQDARRDANRCDKAQHFTRRKNLWQLLKYPFLPNDKKMEVKIG